MSEFKPGAGGLHSRCFCYLLLCSAEASASLCHGPWGTQECENYTYAGSLVEDLNPPAALDEVVRLHNELGAVLYPDHVADLCGAQITQWMQQVQSYFETDTYHVPLIQLLPMQNHIMANHEDVAQRCPVAWLMTLLLKMESNLQHSQRGMTCARVHARGCLRDARGYWKLYASTRLQYASVPPTAEAHADTLFKGELRIVSSFRQTLGKPPQP